MPVEPTHTLRAPVTSAGNGLTVKGTVVLQPEGSVYVTVDVPGAKLVTLPAPPPNAITVANVLVYMPEGSES